MNSSGIKRGVAATAISALAVTGLPFLASSASAETVADRFGDANAIAFYTQNVAGNVFSAKNDGTNTTASLVVGGGANVTSVQYQYQATASGATWNNIGAPVARNADGVFKADWSTPPADVVAIRAVPNTGLANRVEKTPSTNAAAAADTVELASEGSLGVFQEPYSEGPQAATDSDLLGVTGTVSEGTTGVTVTDASHGTGASDAGTVETTTDTTSDTFNAVVDIDGYPYSPGTDPNQIALNAAATGAGTDTDDAEGSTLYVQTIGSITADPATQQDVTPADATVTLTVLDTQGKPVAGAQVFRGGDSDTDGGGSDTDVDGAEALVGYTDGRGQIEADPAFDSAATPGTGSAGTETYYVNTTDADGYEPGTDPKVDATVTTYTPVLTTVDIVNDSGRSNFDVDEVSETPSDDFHIETLDQNGNLYDEDANSTDGDPSDIEYRYVFDATGATPATTTAWFDADDQGDGRFLINDLGAGDGDYTIEARRPNVAGTGLKNAAPENYTASEATVSFDGGASENAPVNGDYTATGTVANADGGLGGREVQLSYDPTSPTADGGDATFAQQSEQPSGVTIVNPYTATAVTDANGDFSISFSDQEIPPNVDPTPEDGTLSATDVQETADDTTSLNASDDQVVNWQEQPAVDSISIDVDEAGFGDAGPGAPVDLDIVVEDADGNPLQDFPVEVSVDKGFLSPNAEVEDDLTLADGHDAEGDLWGFFQNDGQTQTVSTDDAAEAGIVAAMERDADFDDDGLSTMTITVTAGDVTETETVTFDARVLLNQQDGSLERAAGEPMGPVPTDQDVNFQLYVHDQFDNLVGDQFARITDDSTVADFQTDEDFDQTLSDFTNSGPGVRAFSDAPATQTLFAAMSPGEQLVDNAGDRESNNRNVTVASDPIEWVDATDDTKKNPGLVVKGYGHRAGNDDVIANARNTASGARVKLFRVRHHKRHLIAKAFLNKYGNHKFNNIKDKNGRHKTKYKVIVKPTETTSRGKGGVRLH